MSIKSVSPIDGRYKEKTKELSDYFSEYAYHKYRVKVEIEYLIFFSDKNIFDVKNSDFIELKKIYENFTIENALRIKEIEKTTNHDVKAIEYFIKEKVKELNIEFNYEFIHFGLTSQDINSLSNVLRLRDAMNNNVIPLIEKVIDLLRYMGLGNIALPMLSRTHGQPASPTLLGKELLVFYERLKNQISKHQKQGVKNIIYSTKFGGAVGNNNANYFAKDDFKWNENFDLFLNSLNIERHNYTTQIDHYDNLSEIFDNLNRISIILVDMCRDFWQYISYNYFTQKVIKTETGSSTMPHKVNPIDFENAEGNLLIASCMFQFFSRKLPISRLQRDLTDSTITRNIGTSLAYMVIALKSCIKGINKLSVNEDQISRELLNNNIVIAEGIQTLLRFHNIPNAYEKIKNLTRNNNNKINKQDIEKLINTLEISDDIKEKIRNITPFNYVGKVSKNNSLIN